MTTPPPIIQRLPTFVLPATPDIAAMIVCAPMRTLCAICTRLSSFTPSSMTVSSIAPRSIVVFAPISTSSPITTLPTCGIFCHVPRSGAKPKPSAPMTAPGCTMQRAPMRTPSSSVTRGPMRVPSPTATFAPSTVPAPMTAPVADRAVAADDGVRVDLRARGHARARRDDGARVHAGDDGCRRVQRRSDARVGEIRLGMHEARDGARVRDRAARR